MAKSLCLIIDVSSSLHFGEIKFDENQSNPPRGALNNKFRLVLNEKKMK